MLKNLLFFSILLVFPAFSFAQKHDLAKSDSCTDPYLHGEMVSYNDYFIPQGFSIQLFKKIQFEKNAFVPVRVHLEKDKMYQINFVANRFFQTATIALIDSSRKVVYQEKYKGKTSQQHWFTKSVAAPYTGYYWVVLSQKAKDRDVVCGGLSVLVAGN